MKRSFFAILILASFSMTFEFAARAAEVECITDGLVIPLGEIDDSYLESAVDADGEKQIRFGVDAIKIYPFDEPYIFEFTFHRTVAGLRVVGLVQFDTRARTYTIYSANWDEDRQTVSCDDLKFRMRF